MLDILAEVHIPSDRRNFVANKMWLGVVSSSIIHTLTDTSQIWLYLLSIVLLPISHEYRFNELLKWIYNVIEWRMLTNSNHFSLSDRQVLHLVYSRQRIIFVEQRLQFGTMQKCIVSSIKLKLARSVVVES